MSDREANLIATIEQYDGWVLDLKMQFEDLRHALYDLVSNFEATEDDKWTCVLGDDEYQAVLDMFYLMEDDR